MEIIKRKILLEDSIDRNYNSQTWGTLTATSFFINVFLTQNIEDMGLFTGFDFIELNNPVDYTTLTNKLNLSGLTFSFMSGASSNISNYSLTDDFILRLPSKTVVDYYNYLNLPITGYTNSKINSVMSYDNAQKFKPGFDINKEIYINYLGTYISGVTRFVNSGNPSVYVFDTINDNNIGTNNQIYGLQYADYSGYTKEKISTNVVKNQLMTNFRFIGEAFNETNTSLSALTKEEYLFGIISPPEVKNDVFIDRNSISIMDMHLRMSEIKNLAQLDRYGNGFYNITRE